MKTVLITGATGNVGSRLAAEYLADADVALKVLVRGKDEEEAAARVRRVLGYWDVDVDAAIAGGRLEVLTGDIGRANLGVTADVAERLVRDIQYIVHAAANIKLNLPIEEARAQILLGTQNVFACAEGCRNNGQFIRFTFVSTMEVTGDYDGIVYEEFLGKYKRNFLNTYEIAKAEAEDFLERKSKSGFPVAIVRPSMVVGESTTGKALDFQSFYYMIENMYLHPKSRILPRGCNVDAIPVDVLAQGIKCVTESPDSNGKVYHMTQGLDDKVSFQDFIERLETVYEPILGRKLRKPLFVDPRIFRALMNLVRPFAFGGLRRELDNQLIFIQFMFLDFRFDNSRMRSLLANQGILAPKFDTYLPVLCRYHWEQKASQLI